MTGTTPLAVHVTTYLNMCTVLELCLFLAMSHFQLSSRNRKSCKSKITVLTVNIYFSINKSCHSNIFNMNSKDFSSGS